MAAVLRPRERMAIIQSLKAGVTPRIGLEHIQVGRVNEIKALIGDLERIEQGGSAFRIIIGDFGAGKSFFLQLVRYIALEKGMVVINADLSPDRRLYSTSGQARSLYQELIKNISTRTFQDGYALGAIVEKFITAQKLEAQKRNCTVQEVIQEKLISLTELVGGYDFASVINQYYEASENGDDFKKECVIRYLRGEYATKSDAKRDLDVRTIVDDASFYDRLKLLSRFVIQAGFKGLLINLDEMVNLFKIPNSKSRNANYEQILRILNDCLQGSTEYIGFLLGGTPEFLLDPRRGLYSYEALRSRLAENTFAQIANVVDYNNIVLTLQNLTPEELYVLLTNIRRVYANNKEENYLVPDEALSAFLKHCNENIGEAYFKTPRNTIKAFVDLLSVLEQNKDLKWQSLIGNISIAKEEGSIQDNLKDNDDTTLNTTGSMDDDNLTAFKL